MPLPPWIISELEEEHLRREEEARVRSSRIELPVHPGGASVSDEDASPQQRPASGLQIIDISPRDANVIDL